MAHPDRLAVLELLYKEKTSGLTVKAACEQLGLQQPIVSRHLIILKNAGLICRWHEGFIDVFSKTRCQLSISSTGSLRIFTNPVYHTLT